MKTLLLTALLLTSCGGSDGSGSASDAPTSEVKAEGQDSPVKRQSISLATAADLPACDALLKHQLAYIQDEESFYVCDSEWVKISIEGADGSNGVDGVTTIEQVEATNKKNQWVDPISGLEWLIGGGGTYAQAQASCASPYRVPTWFEAEAAIGHGLRAIAASIPATTNFWIDPTGTGQVGAWYATETAGLPNKFSVAATSGYAIYCVK